jgi:NAD-dependent dihydropyrimidine dehydrogenase PreA subunit
MIDIKEKKNCCGCEACVQRCPKSCITMREDNEGFLYPEVDKNICIDCGLCEKVCPVINQAEERKPLAVYAAKHKDEQIRMASSSGGAFTAIAESVIDEGGVVFGAKFNQDCDVVHSYTETKEGLGAFRGSKYVQSRIGESYKEAEGFLKAGRKVLFSGTPCQIAGLKRFLRKEYDNLLTVDFICHGVPSPGVWREYLKEETARQCGEKNSVLQRPIHERNALIEGISFRDKRLGWKKFSFALALSTTNGSGAKNTVLLSEPLNKNIFLRGFLADLYLRPSCHACPSKSFKSRSDITIGDFWGVQNVMPEIDDDKGVSVVMVNSEKAGTLVEKISIEKFFVKYDDVLPYNRAIELSTKYTIKRDSFFLNQNVSFDKLVHRLSKVSVFQRVRIFMIRIISRWLCFFM